MGEVIDITLAASLNCKSAVQNFPQYYGPPTPDVGSDPVYGSKIRDEQGLRTTYGFGDQPLTNAQIEQLKSVAQDMGTLTDDKTWPAVTSPSQNVFFFDFKDPTSDREVVLDDLPTLVQDPCNPPIVVIRDGNAVMRKPPPGPVKPPVIGSVFLISTAQSTTYGSVSLNGGTLQGALAANTVDLGGNVVLSQAVCAADSVPPQLLDISVSSYNEDD